jgi:hypothetical protein
MALEFGAQERSHAEAFPRHSETRPGDALAEDGLHSDFSRF